MILINTLAQKVYYFLINASVCHVQNELDEAVSAWNNHRIRASHNPWAPNGRPSLMYAVPRLYGAQNFLLTADEMKIEICQEDCCFKDYPCDEDVFSLCMELMAEHNLAMSDKSLTSISEFVK